MNQDPNKEIKQKLLTIPILFIAVVAVCIAVSASLIIMYDMHQQLDVLQSNINDTMLLTKISNTLNETTTDIYINIAITTLMIIALFSIILIPIIKKTFIKRLDNVQNGIFDFFDFLDGKKSQLKYIDKVTGAISNAINTRMQHIQKNISEDKAFISAFIEIVSKVKHGDYSKVITVKPHNPLLQQAYTGTNEMIKSLETDIGHDLNQILDIIEEYAQENYTNTITNPSGKVELSINKLRDVIVHMLHENRQHNMKFKQRAQNVNQNINTVYTNIDHKLKHSFEKILVSVDEVTHHIKNNVESASYMASFSQAVTDSAKDGESLANQTALAMNDIKEKVETINNAISVIDKITMQTNILSLNAAVEASSAGEYGKGFAVVAQEVRNLAAQTANASKDIKQIVEIAQQKTDTGSQIATKMIEGYHDLVSQVSKTMELIYEITQNSNVQDENIHLIHERLTNLSDMIEESTEALYKARELSNENLKNAQKSLEGIEEKQFTCI